jgi:hypothetical protein
MTKRQSPKLIWLVILGLAIAAVPAVHSGPEQPKRDGANSKSEAPDPSELQTVRVGGDMEVQVESRARGYFVGDAAITTPLPEGYPAPTPPGAFEIKHYPSVRRAQVSSDGGVNPDRGQNVGFWPLFRHIEANGIAMTAPVEMEYEGLGANGRGDMFRWTMSFLYRTPDLHPVGTDRVNERVTIVDTEPVTVLAVGYLGDYNLLRVRAELSRLNAWIESQTEWEVAGDPRSFGYNDPSVPRSRRWGEVQIPIRRVPVPEESAPVSTEQEEAKPSSR